MARTYVLENGRPREVEPDEWMEWFCTADRQIDYTETEILGDPVCVSTVFVGIDPRPCSSAYGDDYGDRPPPPLYETVIFGCLYGPVSRRAATLGEAKRNHYEAVAIVRADKKELEREQAMTHLAAAKFFAIATMAAIVSAAIWYTLADDLCTRVSLMACFGFCAMGAGETVLHERMLRRSEGANDEEGEAT